MAIATITGAEWNRQGVTREVLLVGRYAIKIPKLIYGWHKFLCGLLANMQEAQFSACGWPELCPVIFSIPGGWLVIMRRADPLTDEQWEAFDARKFVDRHDRCIPAETKRDSFGFLAGRIVALDYGN